jgi:hypothetical protein
VSLNLNFLRQKINSLKFQEQLKKTMGESKESNIGQRKPVSRFQVILRATTAGISVANIYYNQPILKEISTTFHTTDSKAGFVSILSQIGYGLGLFFINPLGDKVNKKDLVIYSLDETSHSRINTIFMTSVFTGGARGTLAGILCWQRWGWSGVTGHSLYQLY